MPVYPSCSFKDEHAADMGFIHYTSMWSILHYPVAVVPITEVKENECTYEDAYNDNWTKVLQKDIEGSAGMPLGVSIVALPWEDEIALGVMKAIDDQVAFVKRPNF